MAAAGIRSAATAPITFAFIEFPSGANYTPSELSRSASSAGSAAAERWRGFVTVRLGSPWRQRGRPAGEGETLALRCQQSLGDEPASRSVRAAREPPFESERNGDHQDTKHDRIPRLLHAVEIRLV